MIDFPLQSAHIRRRIPRFLYEGTLFCANNSSRLFIIGVSRLSSRASSDHRASIRQTRFAPLTAVLTTDNSASHPESANKASGAFPIDQQRACLRAQFLQQRVYRAAYFWARIFLLDGSSSAIKILSANLVPRFKELKSLLIASVPFIDSICLS